MNVVKPVRYNFTHEFVAQIREFTQTHCDLPRKTFQSEWKSWIDSIMSEIVDEQRRLQKSGYDKTLDEIILKMYKSARFYHINKVVDSDGSTTAESSGSDDTSSLGDKIKGFSKPFLRVMDEHIKQKIVDSVDETVGYSVITPGDAYRAFCTDCVDQIRDELVALRRIHNELLDAGMITAKLEKSYKNRFYKCARACASEE
jgi:hypothetical protein